MSDRAGSSKGLRFIALIGIVSGTVLWAEWSRRRRRLWTRDLKEWAKFKVLDLRDEESFARGHFRGSHNITHQSLWGELRWFELPDKHEKLLVLVPPRPHGLLARVEAEMSERRLPGSTKIVVATPWLMGAVERMGLIEQGLPKPGEACLLPLFTPCGFLSRVAAGIEKQLRRDGLPVTCLDVGCGSGRDVVWLAMRGWQVTAVDCWTVALLRTTQLAERMDVSHRVVVIKGKVVNTGEIKLAMKPPVAEKALSITTLPPPPAAGFGGYNGCPLRSNCGQENREETPKGSGGMKLEEQGGIANITVPAEGVGVDGYTLCENDPESSSPIELRSSYGLVLVIRFLERNAYDTLARLITPGGYLLMSTFIEEVAEGEEGCGERCGTPAEVKGVTRVNGGARGRPGTNSGKFVAEDFKKRWPHKSPRDPKKVLRRGELASRFSPVQGFEVLEDSVNHLADGRPVCCFLAHKRPHNGSVSPNVAPCDLLSDMAW